MPDDDLGRMLTQSLRTMSEDADPTTTGEPPAPGVGTDVAWRWPLRP